MANSWLQNHSLPDKGSPSTTREFGESYSEDSHSDLPFDLPPLPIENNDFLPSRYFIPGWSGNSLFSKAAIEVKKVQEKLWEDALSQFKKSGNFPRSLSLAIHNEFLNFIAASHNEDLDQLKNPAVFWKHLFNSESIYKETLKQFSEIYSFRVATNYLSRLKFLVTFSRAIDFKYTSSHIVNPSSFSQQLFRKGFSRRSFFF